jgi:hypothetical protein
VQYLFPFLGAIGFIFRWWLVQYKLKDELAIDRGHLSRVLVYVLCLALLLDFAANVFSLIVVTALPTMVMAFLWFDIPFYRHTIMIDPLYQKNKVWAIVERLTLHPPMIIAGVYLYVLDITKIFPGGFPIEVLASGVIIIYGAYLLFDPRITKKQSHPAGYIILLAAILETVFIVLYMEFFYYWVPRA